MLITIGECEFGTGPLIPTVCGALADDWNDPKNERAWVRLVARDRGVDPRRLLRDFEVGLAHNQQVEDIYDPIGVAI